MNLFFDVFKKFKLCFFSWFILIVISNNSTQVVKFISESGGDFVLKNTESTLDWSILICTRPLRLKSLSFIVNKLASQIQKAGLEEKIEIVVFSDLGEHTTGFKRNMPLKRCCGEYVSFVDDDDDVSEKYISSIYEKITHKPDVVAMKIAYISEHKVQRIFVRSIKTSPRFVGIPRLVKGVGYYGVVAAVFGSNFRMNFLLPLHDPILREAGCIQIFCGLVNHLNPVRRQIALHCLFPDWVFLEDGEYSGRLFGSGLLKNEIMMEDILYYYLQ